MTDVKDYTELYNAIISLNTQEDCENFFQDLCTYKEIAAMNQRVIAARLLSEGKTYEKIINQTEISSATLSRVNKCLKYGKGYKKLFQKD